jgi:GGDEF domain-containing protein
MYAGAFALDRIQTITTRFGPELSDQVLVFFVQHLSQNLSANDQLFRWGPSSFLALLDRCESGDEVRRGIDNFLCRRLDHTFQIGSRSVTLPVACTSIIVPLFGSTHSDIVQKLEAFSGKVSRT